jgi:hypothetical protein
LITNVLSLMLLYIKTAVDYTQALAINEYAHDFQHDRFL